MRASASFGRRWVLKIHLPTHARMERGPRTQSTPVTLVSILEVPVSVWHNVAIIGSPALIQYISMDIPMDTGTRTRVHVYWYRSVIQACIHEYRPLPARLQYFVIL